MNKQPLLNLIFITFIAVSFASCSKTKVDVPPAVNELNCQLNSLKSESYNVTALGDSTLYIGTSNSYQFNEDNIESSEESTQYWGGGVITYEVKKQSKNSYDNQGFLTDSQKTERISALENGQMQVKNSSSVLQYKYVNQKLKEVSQGTPAITIAEYEYSLDGKLERYTEIVPGSRLKTIRVFNNGILVSKTYSDPVGTFKVEYNSQGFRSVEKHIGLGNLAIEMHYKYDPNGNVIKRERYENSVLTFYSDYTYGQENQQMKASGSFKGHPVIPSEYQSDKNLLLSINNYQLNKQTGKYDKLNKTQHSYLVNKLGQVTQHYITSTTMEVTGIVSNISRYGAVLSYTGCE